MTNKESSALFLDIGNTRSKWVFITPSTEIGTEGLSGALAHTELTNSSNLDPIKSKLNLKEIPTNIICVSVANQQITDQWQTCIKELWPNSNWHRFTSSEYSCGIKNQYQNPNTLGADRWAAMIGASSLHPKQDILVVNAGTATTIDYINQSGEFSGGWIIPGLSMMLGSLAKGTADLPNLSPISQSTSSFGQSTNDCITQGCIQTQIGAILRAIDLIKQPTKVILSGGNSEYMAQQLALALPSHVILFIDKQIVLRGLQTWFKQAT